MKFLSFTLALFLLTSTSFAQKGQTKRPFSLSKGFKNSIGIGSGFYDYKDTTQFMGFINYAPQLDLTNKYSDFSISLNTQLSLGYHIQSKSDSLNFVYADFPLFLQMNIGHLASKDFYNDHGFFLGAGYDGNLFKNKIQHGLLFTAGLRTWILGKSITLRYTYSDLFSISTPVHALSLNLNIGSYLENVKANNKISNFMRSFKQR